MNAERHLPRLCSIVVLVAACSDNPHASADNPHASADFTCGAHVCVGGEFCEQLTPGTNGSAASYQDFTCHPFPTTCEPTPTCGCVAATTSCIQPTCIDDGAGHVWLTCASN
jgi:hypothetical protein